MRIGIIHSRIRVEERLLTEALERRGVAFDLVDVREVVFDIHDPAPWRRFDAVLDRCIGQTQAVAAVRILGRCGVPCVKPAGVLDTSGDKLTTSLRLGQNEIRTPRVRVALEAESGLAAIEQTGYPAVLKPTVGSWGRLLARVTDRD